MFDAQRTKTAGGILRRIEPSRVEPSRIGNLLHALMNRSSSTSAMRRTNGVPVSSYIHNLHIFR